METPDQEENEMAARQEPAPLFKRDLPGCTVHQLLALASTYAQDPEALTLIAAELEDRGIDPYA